MGRFIGLWTNKGKGGTGPGGVETYDRASGITTDSSNNVTAITLGGTEYTNIAYDSGNVGLITAYTERIGGVSQGWEVHYDSSNLVTEIKKPALPVPDGWPFNLANASWNGRAPMYKYTDVYNGGWGSGSGLFLKPDGTSIYTMSADDRIRRHDMSTAFDISTASYHSVSNFNLNHSGGSPSRVLEFKSDGTEVFYGDDTHIRSYSLSTAWDISSITQTANQYQYSGDMSGTAGDMRTFVFKPDGTMMFIVESSDTFANNTSNTNIFAYTLSTAWDLSTAALGAINNTIWNQNYTTAGVRGISFSLAGDYLHLLQGVSGYVFRYGLSTPWDISTLAANPNGFTTYYQATSNWNGAGGQNIQWNRVSTPGGNPAGTRYYVMDGEQEMICEYRPSNPYMCSGAASNSDNNFVNDPYYVDWIHPASQMGKQSHYAVRWSNDGTKLFYAASYSATVIEVTTPWDMKAITNNNLSYTGTQGSGYGPKDIIFNSDGTRMFLGPEIQNKEVRQYNPSTGFDLSTVPNSGNTAAATLSLSMGGSNLECGTNSIDGKHIYAATGGTIYQHTLGTAWDLTTGSSTATASKGGFDNNLQQLEISPDGTQLITFKYSAGSANPVKSWTLSTPFDITTAVQDAGTLDLDTLGLPTISLSGPIAIGDQKWAVFPYYAANAYVIRFT